jgi:hypothetical protein
MSTDFVRVKLLQCECNIVSSATTSGSYSSSGSNSSTNTNSSDAVVSPEWQVAVNITDHVIALPGPGKFFY